MVVPLVVPGARFTATESPCRTKTTSFGFVPSDNAEPMPEDSEGTRAAGPVTAATDRLKATAASFDDSALDEPSLCPGWTRAHVLAHVARNADALTRLLTWARTGHEHHMYPSAQARAADIEAGARQPAAELVQDVHESAERFAKAIMEMPDHGWEQVVRPGLAGQGEPIPSRRVLWLRLRELEIHHADLRADYGPADWPDAFVRRALDETIRSFSRRDDVPAFAVSVDGRPAEPLAQDARVTVSGSAPALLAWLCGRSTGADLTVDPAGHLPILPSWL